MNYKYCVVPGCSSTSKRNRDIKFIHIPRNDKLRRKWIAAMRRKHALSESTTAYCCQEHFDLPNDAENYVRYSLMGGTIVLKQGVVPHIFECQQQRTSSHLKTARSLAKKRIAKAIVEDVPQPSPNAKTSATLIAEATSETLQFNPLVSNTIAVQTEKVIKPNDTDKSKGEQYVPPADVIKSLSDSSQIAAEALLLLSKR